MSLVNAARRRWSFSALSRVTAAGTLTQRASLNVVASALDYGARVVSVFVVTPFLVSGVGDVLYGIWRVLGGFTEYLSAASGRPSQALKWTIASKQTSADVDDKRRDVGSALIVWLLFLPVLGSLGALLVWFAPLLIKDVPLELYGTVRATTGLLVASMIVSTLTHLPRSVLEGENLGYKRMLLSALLVLTGGCLAIGAVLLNLGLVGVAAATLVTMVLTGALFLFVARRYVPWFGVARPAGKAVRRFVGLSGWFLGWRFVMQMMRAGDIIILGMFGSAELVTVYSLTKYAPETLLDVVAILVLGAAPGLGGILGAGDLQKAARVRGEIMLLTWLVTMSIGITILVWNPSFVSLWVGGERFAGTGANLLILVLIVQFVLIRSDAMIIDLTLDLARKVLLGLLSVAVSVGLAIVLVVRFELGIVGLVTGFLAGRAILSVSYPLLIGRVLGTSAWTQLKGIVRPGLVSAALLLSAWWAGSHLGSWIAQVGSNWVTLVIAAAATQACATVLAVSLGFTGEQRTRVLRRVRALVPRG